MQNARCRMQNQNRDEFCILHSAFCIHNLAMTEAQGQKQLLGHPIGLFVCFFTEMWERASYYGMRALLVLYMTGSVMQPGLGFPDAKATKIYGLYTMLVYLMGIPGGFVADARQLVHPVEDQLRRGARVA